MSEDERWTIHECSVNSSPDVEGPHIGENDPPVEVVRASQLDAAIARAKEDLEIAVDVQEAYRAERDAAIAERDKWEAAFNEYAPKIEAIHAATVTERNEAQAQLRDREQTIRLLVERLAKQPCRDYPKEKQPNRFNCLATQAEARKNFDDYKNEYRERVLAPDWPCDSCLARSALTSPESNA